MRVLSRIFGGESRALTSETLPAVMLQPTIAGEPVSVRSALGIVDVLACVRLLATVAGSLPLHAFRRVAGEGRVRVTNGSLPSLLERPAPGVTQANLIADIVASLAARGNAFVGLFAGPEGSVEQLGVLQPERVEVEIRRGEPRYRLTHDSGAQTMHGRDDIVHIRNGFSLDGVLGVSPISLAREALGLAQSLTASASATFANASTPKGVLTVTSGPLADEVMSNLRSGFEARHRGSENAGRVAVLSSDVKFTAVSLSPADSEFVATRKLSTAEVARLFGVPPSLIAAESGNSLTYSTTELEAAHFARFTLAPTYLVPIEQSLSASALCRGGQWVEFNLEGLLRADSGARADFYTRALDPSTGWMTRSEVRALENLPPEPAADERPRLAEVS